MSAQPDPSLLFRAGLLDGVSVLCAGEPGPLGSEVERTCARLGAGVARLVPGADGARADLLCYDGDGTFASTAGVRDALDVCLEQAWEVTRALVAAPLLQAQAGRREGADGSSRTAGGDRPAGAHPSRIVFIAPRADSGPLAEAAVAGLENLARTLSIEWARHGVSTVAIAPGAGTEAADVAALVAYLASAAGGYFSGCLFDLRGPQVSLRP